MIQLTKCPKCHADMGEHRCDNGIPLLSRKFICSHCRNLFNVYVDDKKLEDKLDIYREALMFYATHEPSEYEQETSESAYVADRGGRAQKALKQVEEMK